MSIAGVLPAVLEATANTGDADRLHCVSACCMEFLAAHHTGVAEGQGADWRRLRLAGGAERVVWDCWWR
jgi:hypothetical protein